MRELAIVLVAATVLSLFCATWAAGYRMGVSDMRTAFCGPKGRR